MIASKGSSCAERVMLFVVFSAETKRLGNMKGGNSNNKVFCLPFPSLGWKPKVGCSIAYMWLYIILLEFHCCYFIYDESTIIDS